MTLPDLVAIAGDKTRFGNLGDYIDFARRYLAFVADPRNLQAEIVSQNETHYRFFQYREAGHHNITRPLNSRLMIAADDFDRRSAAMLEALGHAADIRPEDTDRRNLFAATIYTLQQAIGATLDALPAGQSNKARKVNGDLFERLIQLLVVATGVDCTGGEVRVPVIVGGVTLFKMRYQHDLVIRSGEAIKVIGGVKTSGKDRLDKVFVDKFLYGRLTGRSVPHVAIFLNDVQRKTRPKVANWYGVGSTFLPGHFKGYTVKLNPLDGVYYCDLRPNMATDPLLAAHIRTIDHFFCRDLWDLLARPGDDRAEVVD